MFALNEKLFPFFYAAGHHNAFWDTLAVFFAQYLPYLLVLAFLVLVYYQKGSRRKIYLFCEAVLAIILSRGLVVEIIRHFYPEPRPFSFYNFTPLISESGQSFPSSHAAWFFALAMVVWYTNRKWGWWFFGLATLMGLARIYTGVHWPIDIIAGAAVGFLSALFVRWALTKSRESLERV